MQQSNILTIILPTHFEQPDLRQDLVTTMQPARHNITNQHLSSLHYTTKHTDAHVHYFNSYLSGELGYASNLTDYYWPAYTQCRGDRLVNGRGCPLSSVGVCNTARRACRRLHARRPGDDDMRPPV